MSKIVTIDFETYYDKDYSLSKITTEAYVRDPRFQVIGFSYKIGYEPAVWVSGDDEWIKEHLHLLHLTDKTVLAHNMAFDGFILAERYGIHPKFMLDTLSMARPITGLTVGGSLSKLATKFCLGEKGTEIINALGKRLQDFSPDELARYGDYCINDTVLTWNLYHVLKQWTPDSELYVIDLMLRMFTDPVLTLDLDLLKVHLTYIQQKKGLLLSQIEDLGITKPMLMSNPQLADILRGLGVEPPMKHSPAALKRGEYVDTYAFSKSDLEFKALLDHENELVSAIVSARLGVKSTQEETRTQAFIGIAGRGTMPVPLAYWAAHTGRAGGQDGINLQNLGAESPLRQAMQPPEGHSMIESDASQIEARVLPWLAGQEDLLEDFRLGKDVYSIFASEVYGRPITRADKAERFLGKTSILGLGFGTGADKLKFTLKLGGRGQAGIEMILSESERVVDLYRAKYDKIPALWESGKKAIKAMVDGYEYELGVGIKLRCTPEGIHLPNGTMLRFPNLRKQGKEYVYDTRKGPVKLYGAKLIENVVQALARCITFWHMSKIDYKLREKDSPASRFKVILTVHDSIAAIFPTPAAEKVKAFVIKVMSVAPKWAVGLPLACEANVGKNYGELK